MHGCKAKFQTKPKFRLNSLKEMNQSELVSRQTEKPNMPQKPKEETAELTEVGQPETSLQSKRMP